MMKFSIVYSFLLCFLFCNCAKKEDVIPSPRTLEDTKFLNFTRAMENGSTFYYFTVVKVKNLNTGEIKEICVDGNFVSGALYKEYGSEYKQVYELKKLIKSRYFEFKNREALENISFFDYDPKLVKVVCEKYNINQIVDSIEKKGRFGIGLNEEEMKAMAHALFDKGYLTGEYSCFGGSLIYVSEGDLKIREQQIREMVDFSRR